VRKQTRLALRHLAQPLLGPSSVTAQTLELACGPQGQFAVEMSQGWMPIPPKLDSHSSANWTPDPPQTGRLFQRKLDSRSEATHGVDAVYALRVTSVNAGLSRHW